jgi:DNA-binding MarR family transcriptional regulator
MQRNARRRREPTKAVPDTSAAYAEAAAVCACSSFRKASRAVTQLFDEALQPSGLRSTQLILILEIAVAEPATVTRLARKLVMDPSTVTRNLQPLVKRGLLASVAGDRNQTFRLTPRGRETLERAVPLWERTQTAFVERLGAERWQTMLRDLSDAVSVARGGGNA